MTELLTNEEIAGQIEAALASADLDAFRDLLDPNVAWGAPDDEQWGCHNRDQVLAWYRRGRAAGVRAAVTEVIVGDDKLLVGLKVVDAEESVDRWQVLTLAGGRVVDIRGFEDRQEAAVRAGVAG